MKRDGREVPVEVDGELTYVTVAGTRWPVKLRADRSGKVDLEIAGMPVVVGGWPAPCADPPAAVEVNGEAWTVEVVLAAGSAPPSPPAMAAPSALPESDRAAPVGGAAIVPPMPGRVIEIRVKDGERVPAGAVLLVLEAMKMRNEIVAPVAGVVRSVRVQEGSNVRAREAMLLIAPE